MQGGRLAQLKTGYSTVSDSLQDMRYTYDLAGNVLTISDYKAGGIQTQTFAYDDLDRLVSAVASGGTGGTYSLQNYAYNPDTGNLARNAGVNYTYGDNAHKHAITGTSDGCSYGYDANGNQTTRTVGGLTYTLIYDAENRLVQIKRGSNIQATYYYDGGGNRVKTVVGSTTTTYIGNYLEWTGSTTTMKKYYYAGGQRVAMRQGSSTLYFLLTDHLGSTAVTATSGGGFSAEMRYYPWGGTRYSSGTTPTSYRYTGQREAEVGLYYYGARYYDPYLNRWIQPDSIIPDTSNPSSWDRYAYVLNNPIRFNDPTGHDRDCGIGDEYCSATKHEYMESGLPEYGVSFDLYFQGRDSYYYYYNHPDVAFDDMYGNGGEADAVLGARIYSEYVKRQLFEPISDFMILDRLDEARSSNDTQTWITLASGLFLADYLSDQFGGNGYSVSGIFPARSSSSYLYRTDNSGNVTHFAVYNEVGEISYRVDMVGRAHGGVPTPHIQYPIWNIDPKTGTRYLNGWTDTQPWQP